MVLHREELGRWLQQIIYKWWKTANVEKGNRSISFRFLSIVHIHIWIYDWFARLLVQTCDGEMLQRCKSADWSISSVAESSYAGALRQLLLGFVLSAAASEAHRPTLSSSATVKIKQSWSKRRFLNRRSKNKSDARDIIRDTEHCQELLEKQRRRNIRQKHSCCC